MKPLNEGPRKTNRKGSNPNPPNRPKPPPPPVPPLSWPPRSGDSLVARLSRDPELSEYDNGYNAGHRAATVQHRAALAELRAAYDAYKHTPSVLSSSDLMRAVAELCK